ncbi:hypothetical protein [Pseudoalteromonas caenipelagi]|nr:hypothetical protein [Pseudoalteromonas caenipelagi]
MYKEKKTKRELPQEILEYIFGGSGGGGANGIEPPRKTNNPTPS